MAPNDGKQIYTLLPKLAHDIGSIGKERENPQGWKFRSIDQLLNKCGPLFAKHGIATTVHCSDLEMYRTTRPTRSGEQMVIHVTVLVNVILTAPDGSFTTLRAYGEGMDFNGDKATNKAMAGGFKYALFLGLCVPIEADAIEDSDRYTPEQTSGHYDAPGEHIGKFAEARAVIATCMTIGDLDKCRKRLRPLLETGELDTEQVAALETDIQKRTKQFLKLEKATANG